MKKYKIKYMIAIFFICLMSVQMWPQKAEACCSCDNSRERSLDRNWFSHDRSTVKVGVTHLEGEFSTHKLFVAGILWEDNLLPALMLMTEQLSAVAMQQMRMIGSLMDAEIQIETQQLFQVEQAKIRKIYQPSQGVCEIGTAVRSLAASDRRKEITAIALSQRAEDRDLGNMNSSAYSGEAIDKEGRLLQFAEEFCELRDNNNGLGDLCQSQPALTERINKDIDFARTMYYPWTVNLDFTDTGLTNNEEEVLALSSNLYGSMPLARPPSSTLTANVNNSELTDMQEAYMESRSIMAKRSVARNSFNALAAEKSPGTPGSREFLINVLQDLGIEAQADGLDEIELIKRMLGDDPDDPHKVEVEPSYNAQMEILTKKLYQDPDFYTNLYDTPVNVDRKKVAMQAIGLMQKFDVFKSYLRQEASVSVLLELAVMNMQEKVESELNKKK